MPKNEDKHPIVEMAKMFAQVENMKAFEEELISLAKQAYALGVEDGKR